jgi:hypothetical protein
MAMKPQRRLQQVLKTLLHVLGTVFSQFVVLLPGEPWNRHRADGHGTADRGEDHHVGTAPTTACGPSSYHCASPPPFFLGFLGSIFDLRIRLLGCRRNVLPIRT